MILGVFSLFSFVRYVNKMASVLDVLRFFMNNSWTFAKENSEALNDMMCLNEKNREVCFILAFTVIPLTFI